MIAFELSAKFKYRIKAKNRHGLHSPFVYRLMDEVLLNKNSNIPLSIPQELNALTSAYRILAAKIIQHCKNNIANYPISPQCMVTTTANFLAQMPTVFNPQQIIILQNLHNTPTNQKAWQQIIAMPNIKLSIDLYGIGVLLFCDSFIEKQHFVLQRYL